mmetsp:Transcript_5944/g.6406  ORF Transcript_5944/g.6406 Transcript_5944/m.6406 type:complete len:80 (-) Transcript_5944:80-319(-)
MVLRCQRACERRERSGRMLRKCRLLIESSADVYAKYRNSNMLEWARERINVRFAEYLEGLTNGKSVDYTMALDIPRDTD